MRARLALYYSSCKVEHREVVLRDKPAEMLQASPKGTVPVLVLADGHVIDESLDIMRWALAQTDPDGWLSSLEDSQLQLANELIAFNDDEFKVHLDHYKYAVRFPEQSMETYRQQGEVFLQRLEDMLVNTPFLFGDNMSIADAAVFPFVRQFAHVDKPWFDTAPYPHVQDWLNKHLDSALFSAIMKKYPRWCRDDEIIIVP